MRLHQVKNNKEFVAFKKFWKSILSLFSFIINFIALSFKSDILSKFSSNILSKSSPWSWCSVSR